MLKYLVYRSTKVDSTGEVELRDIINQATVKNEARGITGILINYDQTFLQYIEGESASITELFNRIKSDPRHQNIELEFEGKLNKRLFPDWSMALEVVDDELFSKVDSYKSLESGNEFIRSLEDDQSNLGLKMLRYFFDLKNKLNSLGKT